ncbi:Cytochrome c553 [Methylobacterium sp. UNC300MFChir4.1]|uniref:c-type cytochrome n=1 Tax=Methylobacterium sp. UNC300MFChir4.1 TaxID=1502747 RepID=UPI0008D01B10|nr:c-type cytochrome [Methylobacterium sp. UNC300MFChir4.1]SEM89292.1 Cytochrome c553 [Methylobacterium sp. UNC300MFChir4.1]
MRRPTRAAGGLVPALGGLLLAGAALAAPDAAMQERLAPCIGCHGAGTSATEGVPSLGGQLPDYVVTQLFQFREKQREAPPMNEVAAGFSDDDLRAYADAVATLPPPAWSGTPADAALAARAQALVAKHQCNSCHGPDLAGRDAIPRIRAQREEYLAKALAGYKSNARPGYDPAMNEVAQGLSEADIKDLAAYVSRL